MRALLLSSPDTIQETLIKNGTNSENHERFLKQITWHIHCLVCFFSHMQQLRRLSHQLDAVFPWLVHYLPKGNLSCPELFHIMLSHFFVPAFMNSGKKWREREREIYVITFSASFQLSEQSVLTSGAFVQLCKSRVHLWNWFETHFLGKLCNEPVHSDLFIFNCIVILK